MQVFGVPDAKYGEELAAWIITKPGQSCTEDEIRALLPRPDRALQGAAPHPIRAGAAGHRDRQAAEVHHARGDDARTGADIGRHRLSHPLTKRSKVAPPQPWGVSSPLFRHDACMATRVRLDPSATMRSPNLHEGRAPCGSLPCLSLPWHSPPPVRGESIVEVLERSQRMRLEMRIPRTSRGRAHLARARQLPAADGRRAAGTRHRVARDGRRPAGRGHARPAAGGGRRGGRSARGRAPDADGRTRSATWCSGTFRELGALYQRHIPAEVRPETTDPVAGALGRDAHAPVAPPRDGGRCLGLGPRACDGRAAGRCAVAADAPAGGARHGHPPGHPAAPGAAALAAGPQRPSWPAWAARARAAAAEPRLNAAGR